MERRGVSMCLHDMAGSRPAGIASGRSSTCGFHGATGKYGGAYPRERLRGWADWMNTSAPRAAATSTPYFNNDVGGHAPRDAAALRQAMEESP
jgi:uncharacterized protein YecE (DUF72 family)